MKKKIALALVVLLSTVAFAADKPAEKTVEKPVAPVVTDAFARKLWRGQTDINTAQLLLERTKEFKSSQAANENMKKITAEWFELCGKDFTPGTDDKGEPVCSPKPEVPKAGKR